MSKVSSKASESRNFFPNGLGKNEDQALEKETRQATAMKILLAI